MLFLPDAKVELKSMGLFWCVFPLLALNFTHVEGNLEEKRENVILLSKKNIILVIGRDFKNSATSK